MAGYYFLPGMTMMTATTTATDHDIDGHTVFPQNIKQKK